MDWLLVLHVAALKDTRHDLLLAAALPSAASACRAAIQHRYALLSQTIHLFFLTSAVLNFDKHVQKLHQQLSELH